MKVKFLIAGAQKSGTSALNRYLKKHPNLCMAKKKEVHFFDNETHFTQKPINYAHYHSYFAPRLLKHLCGESTPNYMYWHNAPRRIWEYNPKMKIIMILRNPIERAYSHWNMEYHNKREFLPFKEAIRTESQRTKEALPYQHRVYAYVDRGFYTDQIRRIWHYFPKEQTLFLKSEDLKMTPKNTIDQVCNFLNVPMLKNVTRQEVHATPYTTPMPEADREYLKTVFKFEIKDLEEMLGWDCGAWV